VDSRNRSYIFDCGRKWGETLMPVVKVSTSADNLPAVIKIQGQVFKVKK